LYSFITAEDDASSAKILRFYSTIGEKMTINGFWFFSWLEGLLVVLNGI
jgi:hypothetical protein